MFTSGHLTAALSAFGLLAGAAVCPAQNATTEELHGMILSLQEQNKTLQRSLVEANQAEKQATAELTQIRERLEALGKNLLDGDEDRRIQAFADLAVEKDRNKDLQAAASKVAAVVYDYLRQAIVSDPDARLRVETSLRELDAVLGLRQKPRPEVRTGTLQQATVVSLDQESGMLVFNLGETQGAKIGMSFRLQHGQQPYGKAILADVRKDISGAFVETIDNLQESPRPGDLAILLTE
ncbi:hypothetical protein JIN85_10395 [Luteolibacter pohnpeiensis]|uniref:Uncharacterized protein n=1 Tax=Luteolibacter pohnpeiensis TaxID=454153 RepID=A0A934S8K3_9BACT|nr:hypothetical protein [Luteolibacter pohnpeiensis]MBK1882826.1 hypothetical protein [Luteolibacter pohnpeiensis]